MAIAIASGRGIPDEDRADGMMSVFLMDAESAIALVIEEAAKVATEAKTAFETERMRSFDSDSDWYLAGKRDGAGSIATAIRALAHNSGVE